MAKQTLPVNFKDDILASSMGGKRKYRLIDNGDGTYSLEDATDYTQTGSDFGAGQINATNQAVNESCDKANVIETMDDIVANQASGMIAGAKAVAELIGNLPLIQSGSTGYIDVPANSYKDVQIEFPKPFESDPNISASIWGMSDSPSYGNINFSYDNISKTGFTMRIYNDNTSARVPRFRWVAIME